MNRYIKQRNKYLPQKIKLVFVFESPPSSNMYFYNDSGRPSEPLFRVMMKTVFNRTFETKKEGLKNFSAKGFILVDPIYKPVDKIDDELADQEILKNYKNFIADLNSLMVNKNTPIVLVKANIHKILSQKLISDEFNVINKDYNIPYPIHYHQLKFSNAIRKIIKKENLR